MRKYLVAVLSAAALVAGVVTASPASALSLSTGDLSGTVTDGVGSPVSGATILVNGGDSATTDGSGHYTVELAVSSTDIASSSGLGGPRRP